MVVRQGRTFLRHLYVILNRAEHHRHYVHLDSEARADLCWWHCFLHHWNGPMFFQRSVTPAAHIYTDASGSFGCGGVLTPSYWFQIQWPPAWAGVDIVVKELVPVVVAAALWGRGWQHLHICFHSDNSAVVDILRKQSARDPQAHHLLRCFYFYSAFFQFEYSVEHVPGVLNTAADAISRNNLHLFSSLLPQATQSQIPDPVMGLLVSQRPDWGSRHWIRLFGSSLPTH